MAKQNHEKGKLLKYDEWIAKNYSSKKLSGNRLVVYNNKSGKTNTYRGQQEIDAFKARLQRSYKEYVEEYNKLNAKTKFVRQRNTKQSKSKKESNELKKAKEQEEKERKYKEKDAERRYAKFAKKQHRTVEHTFIGSQFAELKRKDMNMFIKQMAKKANDIIKEMVDNNEEISPEMQYKINELKRMAKTKEKIGTGWMLRKEKASAYAAELERFVYGSFSTAEKREAYKNRVDKAYNTFTKNREDFADLSQDEYVKLTQWFEAATNEAKIDLSSESVTTVYDYARQNNVRIDPATLYREAKKRAKEAGVPLTQDLYQSYLYTIIEEKMNK